MIDQKAVRPADLGIAKGFTRDASGKADLALPRAFLTAASGPYQPGDLATGRTTQYEWEIVMADMLTRIGDLEAGGGSVPGATGVYSFAFQQSTPAATWSITHNLATKPDVTVVNAAGDLLLVEVTYPSDSTAVVTFGFPTAGSAYLRG